MKRRLAWLSMGAAVIVIVVTYIGGIEIAIHDTFFVLESSSLLVVAVLVYLLSFFLLHYVNKSIADWLLTLASIVSAIVIIGLLIGILVLS